MENKNPKRPKIDRRESLLQKDHYEVQFIELQEKALILRFMQATVKCPSGGHITRRNCSTTSNCRTLATPPGESPVPIRVL